MGKCGVQRVLVQVFSTLLRVSHGNSGCRWVSGSIYPPSPRFARRPDLSRSLTRLSCLAHCWFGRRKCLCFHHCTNSARVTQDYCFVSGMSNRNGTNESGEFSDHGGNRRNRTSYDGEDAHGHKRQRTALACNSCRYRKSRCDGAHPACSTCRSQGLECIYRGPVPATHQHSQDPQYLERRLQRFEGNIESIERRFSRFEDLLLALANKQQGGNDTSANTVRFAVPLDATVSNETTSIQINSTSVPAHSSGLQSDQSSTQQNEPMSRLWPVTMQEDTVDGMGSIIFADESNSGFFGPSSNSSFVNKVAKALASRSSPVRGARDFSRDLGGRLSRPASPPLQSKGSANSVNPYILPPRTEIFRLIEVFFSFTGRFFPYISRSMLTQTVGEVDLNRLSGVRKSTLCLLNAILAMGTSLDETRGRGAKQRDVTSDVFFQRALVLSPWTISNTANLETCENYLTSLITILMLTVI